MTWAAPRRTTITTNRSTHPLLAVAFVLSTSPFDAALAEDSASTRGPAERFTVESPSRELVIELTLGDGGLPRYRVERSGDTIITPSGLGFELAAGVDWTRGFRSLEIVDRREHDSTWSPVWGEHATIRDRYRSATARFRRQAPPGELKVEVRAYDEGVALRYVVERGPTGEEIRIESEQTEFRFTADHDVWAVYSAQGKYSKVPMSEIKHSVERPCVLEPAAGGVIAVAEAALVDYPRMRLRRSKDAAHTLVSRLHGPAVSKLPLRTPWRVVMAAQTAGALLEGNHLILNLNEPCAIEDTSWIKPGKVIRDVTLSTDGSKACIDFAVERGLQFVELDAGWYGDQGDERSDARTVSRPNLDLPAIIRYGKEHGIGVVLYVNRRHLESQLDELLPLYRSWGIAGIKFGFVQHGSQRWTGWMHDAIRKAAAHRLMVDVHDEYRMTGWQRTYPNFMTAEGIGGDETRPSNEQALANLFTRMIVAPADHTFCYYNGYVDQTTSHASQLAKAVCFFSPWQFLFWYDRPANARGEPELELFEHLTTTWDETRVLRSRIGQYAVIARRKGTEWFLGCLNAGEPRTMKVSLDFLPEEASFEAHIYRDDSSVASRTKVAIERRDVDSRTALAASLSRRGGLAARFVPRQDRGRPTKP